MPVARPWAEVDQIHLNANKLKRQLHIARCIAGRTAMWQAPLTHAPKR